jgi:hypothetical protein
VMIVTVATVNDCLGRFQRPDVRNQGTLRRSLIDPDLWSQVPT